ncbi:MAG TPA: hypothetical protein VL588_08030 [Bdellovibrionota bacterium]|nr:hypothetical protein [Bdellovibrionota bacterium]
MNKELFRFFGRFALVGLGAFGVASSAQALELNWSGQFRAGTNWIYNYALDQANRTVDATRFGKGYYIPGGGSQNAFFQEAFLRLRPSVVVNDNIYLKSEWWVGDPVFGFFGNGAPFTSDLRQFYSTGSRGSVISAQRFWAEILTDIGTLQVGRAPLHYGLGLVWNAGNGIWDRYMSTGDVVRLVAKFGAFSIVPSAVKYTTGDNIGGACTDGGICAQTGGDASVVDYSIMLKYENLDQDVEMGVNFIRRLGASNQSTYFSALLGAPSVQGMLYNTYDLYGRKKLGPVQLGVEVPIVSGSVGPAKYSTFALAMEAQAHIWGGLDANVKLGHAPGQEDIVGATPDTFKAYFFNPGYKIGMIMFNYQLANFHGPNTTNTAAATALASPYDNPVVNANYLSAGLGYSLAKWNFHTQWTFANALETASAGSNYYNTWRRKFEASNGDQAQGLGWEMDWGATFHWDESFQFGADVGWFFPGDFYKFSNVVGDANSNAASTVFGAQLKVGVNF